MGCKCEKHESHTDMYCSCLEHEEGTQRKWNKECDPEYCKMWRYACRMTCSCNRLTLPIFKGPKASCDDYAAYSLLMCCTGKNSKRQKHKCKNMRFHLNKVPVSLITSVYHAMEPADAVCTQHLSVKMGSYGLGTFAESFIPKGAFLGGENC